MGASGSEGSTGVRDDEAGLAEDRGPECVGFIGGGGCGEVMLSCVFKGSMAESVSCCVVVGSRVDVAGVVVDVGWGGVACENAAGLLYEGAVAAAGGSGGCAWDEPAAGWWWSDADVMVCEEDATVEVGDSIAGAEFALGSAAAPGTTTDKVLLMP